MFFEAQRKFQNGQLFGKPLQSSYVASLMEQYGDGGKKVNKFREESQADFERALAFRQQEKSYYNSLKTQNESLVQRLASVEKELQREQQRAAKYATVFKDCLTISKRKTEDVAARTDDGDGVDGDRRGVLPAVHADPEARQGEITSNASSETDASVPRSGTRRQRRPVGTKPSVDETGDRNGEGGSSERPGDGPAPDASGQADEHVVEERGGDD